MSARASFSTLSPDRADGRRRAAGPLLIFSVFCEAMERIVSHRFSSRESKTAPQDRGRHKDKDRKQQGLVVDVELYLAFLFFIFF